MKRPGTWIHSSARRAACALAVVAGACSGVGQIDSTGVSPITNDDTYATLGYLWAGARTAIEREREPSVGAFNLPLSYQVPCTRGGNGSYQGTLSGTKTAAGGGSGALSLTATLAECQFEGRTAITTISASGFNLTGTIAISNDMWGTVNIRMVATSVTVNGKLCPGGVDVTLSASSPSAQVISTGTACGRTGAVPLP